MNCLLPSPPKKDLTTAPLLDKPGNVVIPLLPNNFQLSDLREPVITGQTRDEGWRRLQLERFGKLLEDHEVEVIDALYRIKPPFNVNSFAEKCATVAVSDKVFVKKST